MLLGAIADDLTGGTDLALMLARQGMRTVQVVGVPPDEFDFGDAEAVVIALKSRTVPAPEAIQMSLDAARCLVDAGAEQIIFKYCSTFDSTDEGNIGPVTEALLEFLGESVTIACPAFPANARTVFRGHLFVGDVLLSDSPMRDHPLTPMRDANLVRVLQRQTKLPVGLVPHEIVSRGEQGILQAFARARGPGRQILIVDAISDDQLLSIGAAAAGLKLITGGAGIAMGLPENFRRAGKISGLSARSSFEAPTGRAVILAGSCSTATRRQISYAMEAGTPALKINPTGIADGSIDATGVVDWIMSTKRTPIVYSSADPEDVLEAQAKLGRDRAGALVEDLLAEVAVVLRHHGFNRFLVAGGETSGAVVNALDVKALLIGPEIDPGVPWTRSLGSEKPVVLALKSGNFGADDIFIKAWDLLQ
jgi:3-dehydrotetronate 4-kinase